MGARRQSAVPGKILGAGHTHRYQLRGLLDDALRWYHPDVKRLIGVLLFSVGLWAQPPAIVIRGARVVDGTGTPARLVTVVIRGTKIEAVAADAPVPAGAR